MTSFIGLSPAKMVTMASCPRLSLEIQSKFAHFPLKMGLDFDRFMTGTLINMQGITWWPRIKLWNPQALMNQVERFVFSWTFGQKSKSANFFVQTHWFCPWSLGLLTFSWPLAMPIWQKFSRKYLIKAPNFFLRPQSQDFSPIQGPIGTPTGQFGSIFKPQDPLH